MRLVALGFIVFSILCEMKRFSPARAVIFFLNRMVNQGVLDYRSATGKGGHHRVYYPVIDERGYKKHLLKTVVESLKKDFPRNGGEDASY